MDTPRVMVRFRNFDGGDAISAHNSLLGAKKRVLWGLWLKDFENKEDTVQRLNSLSSTLRQIYVADSTHKSEPTIYVATVSKVITDNDINIELVPEYYQDKAAQVPIWFELSSELIRVDVDEKFRDMLGVPTIYFLEYKDGRLTYIEPQRAFDKKKDAQPGYLLHLTDIHLGEDHGFHELGPQDRTDISGQPTLLEALQKDLKKLGVLGRISGVIVSGDIVTRGGWDRFYKFGTSESSGLGIAQQFLQSLSSILNVSPDWFFLVPGNHDIVRQTSAQDSTKDFLLDYKHESGFRTLREQFCKIYKLSPLNYVIRIEVGSKKIILGMLNSAYLNDQTDFVEYGFVGDDAEHVFKTMSDASEYSKVLVLHHHVLPVYEREVLAKNRSISLTLDAANIMRRAQEVGVNLILHGHQHSAKLMNYASWSAEMGREFRQMKSRIKVIAGGSAGAKLDRLPIGESNTYGLVDISKPTLPVRLRRIYSSGRLGEDW